MPTAVITGASSGIGAATARARAGNGFQVVVGARQLELLGEPVRMTEIAPGMVETEFSLVRFGGDEEAAKRVDEIVIRPRDQATATEAHRLP